MKKLLLRGFRGLVVSYRILAALLVLCLVIELVWRAAGGFHHAARSRIVTADNVPYTLHPFFQTVYPPNADALPGPFLAGWRADPMDQAEAPGRKRIMFLGGSTTANEYPRFVRENLEPKVGPLTVYNLGFHWHTSLHSLYKIWTYADVIHPDLIVVLDNVNDFARGFTDPETSLPQYRSDYSHASGGFSPFWTPGHGEYDGRPVFHAKPLERFALYERDDRLSGFLPALGESSAFVYDLHRRFGLKSIQGLEFVTMPPEVYLRALPDFERNLKNIAASCALKQIPVLFLTMPFTTEAVSVFLSPGRFFTNDGVHGLAPPEFIAGMNRFNQVVKERQDEPRAFVFDLASKITDRALFYDEVHLEAVGHREEARVIADYVLERGLLSLR